MSAISPSLRIPEPSQPLLCVEDLSVTIDGKPLVNPISFTLRAGETLALVGESGSGKSLTALSLLQLLPYPRAAHPSGRILLDGKNLVGAPELALRQVRGRDIAMIFQEPMTALNPLHTIEQQIGETLSNHQGCSAAEQRAAVLAWLEKVGIQDAQSRLKAYPHELSGGQRQRVMIAMALINRPRILIADEPTTALDVTVQKHILDLIDSLKHELQMAVLLISHDLGVVRHYSDRVAVMHQGQLVEMAETQTLFSQPQAAYTQQLLTAKPRGKPSPCHSKEPVMKVQDLAVQFVLRKSFWGKPLAYRNALAPTSFEIKAGETLGIIGESGSGKSTLAMALLQLQHHTGTVTFRGQCLETLPGEALRKQRQFLQIVFQDPFSSLSPRFTVEQILAEGLNLHQPGLGAQAKNARLLEALTDVDLPETALHRYPHEFSGGQRQRIAIARALILKPAFMVLDEPTSALDRSVQGQIIDLLRHLQDKYALSYVFISHDIAVVRAMAHRIMVLKQGQVIETGDTETLLTQPQSAYTQELLAAVLE
jgi:microcin C transport system ATP-binding protein